MDSILQQITDWLKEMLVSGIMGNLSGMFESVNNQVGEIATSVGMTPANFSPGVFAMVRNISESVIIPIAGLILTFIACYELIQMIIDHNNLANFETWIFFKWVFKTFVAVMLITNTFNITMAVFDVAQHVVNASAGIIAGDTAIDAAALETMEDTLMAMDLGPLLGLFLQSFIVQVTMSALAIVIFVIVYGRMIEIYLMVSLAPIPFATFGNREQSSVGQNYLRSLFAIGFQGFLIMICVGIYAVLVQSVAFSEDIIASIWGVMGYTVLLCFTLFKTFVAVMLITNTFNITMAVFDVAQHVINASAGIIAGDTAIDAAALETMEDTLMAMDLGPLLGLFLQSLIVQVTMSALAIVIFVIVYGRMIEIYLMVSLAPIPFATFGNREQSSVGQNYLRSLFAIGFQGFLIMICVGIYAVLVQSVAFSEDIIASIWSVMGYTVLLCFTLFKTGSLAKGVFSAH